MSDVLILGGYGCFGGRLSRRLARAGHCVWVAGRSVDKATRFCADVAGCRPLAADRNADLVPMLRTIKPALVIDAAGPFQQSDYRLPVACACLSIPYLDLADDRAFVAGIGEIVATVPIIAGASSVPALSAAVVRELAGGMDRVFAVEAAISASNRATAGRSVATAILASIGQSIRLWRGKRWVRAHGWQQLRRERLELADGTGLGRPLVALADVPDHDVLVDRVADRPAVTFRAGGELAFQNVALWLASWPIRWFGGSLRPLAGLLLPLQRVTARMGGDRSGMVVRVFGMRDGRRVERRWTLIAEDGEGPEIPVLASEILAGRILAGYVSPGARDAGGELSLADFEPSFEPLSVRHEIREFSQPEPLYRRVMGMEFDRLPPAVRDMHSVLRDAGASGRASAARGRNPLARVIAAAIGFPGEGEHALHVAFEEAGGSETWTRDFSGRRFRSRLSQRGGDLVERFGPLRFRFALPRTEDGLRMTMRGWSAFGVPLPLALAPRSEAHEGQDSEGRFTFDVSISLPLIGLIVRYRGWLTPL